MSEISTSERSRNMKSFKKIVTAHYKRMKKATNRRQFSGSARSELMDKAMITIVFDFVHAYGVVISSVKVKSILRIMEQSNYGKSGQIPSDVANAFGDKHRDMLEVVTGRWWTHLVAICVDKSEASLEYIPNIKSVLGAIVKSINKFKVCMWCQTASLIYEWKAAGNHGTVAIIVSSDRSLMGDEYYMVWGTSIRPFVRYIHQYHTCQPISLCSYRRLNL
eukprot:252701_1